MKPAADKQKSWRTAILLSAAIMIVLGSVRSAFCESRDEVEGKVTNKMKYLKLNNKKAIIKFSQFERKILYLKSEEAK